MNEGIHLDLDTWIVPGQIQIFNNDDQYRLPELKSSMYIHTPTQIHPTSQLCCDLYCTLTVLTCQGPDEVDHV